MIILLLFLAPLVMSGAGVSRLLRDGILESEDNGAPETFARQLDNVSPSKLDEAEFRREDFDDDDDIPGHKEHRSAYIDSLFGIPTSPPRLGSHRCGLWKWRHYPCDFADTNDTQGTNLGCSDNKCWRGCSYNCDKPKAVGSWCHTVDDHFLYQKCSTHADCVQARAVRMDCFGRRLSVLLDLMCDAGFQDSMGRDCELYERKQWCKKDGHHYGPSWENFWGDFFSYENGEGKTAKVCPQCGCPSAFLVITHTEPIGIGYRLATRADVLQNWEEVKEVISLYWAIVELEDGEIIGRDYEWPLNTNKSSYKRSGYSHKLITLGAMAAAAKAAAAHQQGEMQRVWEELSNEQQQTEALQRQMAEQRQQQEQPQ